MFYDMKVRYFNDYDDRETVDTGLVYGESLAEAVDKVFDYYGEDKLILVKLESTKYKEVYVKEGESYASISDEKISL